LSGRGGNPIDVEQELTEFQATREVQNIRIN
jgi:hypothetical protein